jgi:hypothetical protein
VATEEVLVMDEGLVVAVLTMLGIVALIAVEAAASWNVAGWLEVRSSRTPDEVRRNLADYGPEVPGLRLDLLPEAERAAVLEQRRARAAERAAAKAARHAH